MKKRAKIALFLSALAGVILISIQASPPVNTGTNGTSRDWERDAPIADSFWVMKLATPLADGSNMLIKVKYLPDSTLPQTIYVFHDNDYSTAFHDNGVYPDAVASDFVYTTSFYQSDITSFVNQFKSLESTIATSGGYVEFKGHAGTEFTSDLPVFDDVSFGNNQWVFVNKGLLSAIDCGSNLKREYSLFITDLSVVEDPARTFKIWDNSATPQGPSGNPKGVWTFGTMMSNMANGNVAPRIFIKEWLRQWTNTTTVNGQSIAPRTDIVPLMIAPWLRVAKNNATLTVTISNWEQIMTDLTTTEEERLLDYAPFKLTAIVNRLDLHSNVSYVPSAMKNVGETRFIFTLIAPMDFTYNMVSNFRGKPVIQPDQIPVGSQDLADWEGFNVIFEYGNVVGNKCDLQAFAQQWYNLSTLGSFPPTGTNTAYNDALEAITNTVTSANANPGKTNGSAINRIRTHERIFFEPNKNWQPAKWEFRQFELDASSKTLKQAPLTNTPINDANFVTGGGLVETNFMDGAQQTTTGVGGTDQTVYAFMNWAFSATVINSVLNGMHNIPVLFPGTTDPFLAGAGKTDGDKVHHWNFWWYNDLAVYKTNSSIFSAKTKSEVRRQISLNTCQGCHNGETKGIFNQVRPLGYGESANYWNSVPDNVYRKMDDRQYSPQIVTINRGRTSISSTVSVPNNEYVSGLRHIQNVSAFLTGVSYTGTGFTGTYDDDNLGTEFKPDNSLDGLYYVNYPTNCGKQGLSSFPYEDGKFGYNDLLMRKQRMCTLLSSSCTPAGDVTSIIIDLASTGPSPDGH